MSTSSKDRRKGGMCGESGVSVPSGRADVRATRGEASSRPSSNVCNSLVSREGSLDSVTRDILEIQGFSPVNGWVPFGIYYGPKLGRDLRLSLEYIKYDINVAETLTSDDIYKQFPRLQDFNLISSGERGFMDSCYSNYLSFLINSTYNEFLSSKEWLPKFISKSKVYPKHCPVNVRALTWKMGYDIWQIGQDNNGFKVFETAGSSVTTECYYHMVNDALRMINLNTVIAYIKTAIRNFTYDPIGPFSEVILATRKSLASEEERFLYDIKMIFAGLTINIPKLIIYNWLIKSNLVDPPDDWFMMGISSPYVNNGVTASLPMYTEMYRDRYVFGYDDFCPKIYFDMSMRSVVNDRELSTLSLDSSLSPVMMPDGNLIIVEKYPKQGSWIPSEKVECGTQFHRPPAMTEACHLLISHMVSMFRGLLFYGDKMYDACPYPLIGIESALDYHPMSGLPPSYRSSDYQKFIDAALRVYHGIMDQSILDLNLAAYFPMPSGPGVSNSDVLYCVLGVIDDVMTDGYASHHLHSKIETIRNGRHELRAPLRVTPRFAYYADLLSRKPGYYFITNWMHSRSKEFKPVSFNYWPDNVSVAEDGPFLMPTELVSIAGCMRPYSRLTFYQRYNVKEYSTVNIRLTAGVVRDEFTEWYSLFDIGGVLKIANAPFDFGVTRFQGRTVEFAKVASIHVPTEKVEWVGKRSSDDEVDVKQKISEYNRSPLVIKPMI